MCGCHVPRLHEQRCVERSVRMCTLSRAWLSLSGTLPSGLGALPVRNGAEKERGNRGENARARSRRVGAKSASSSEKAARLGAGRGCFAAETGGGLRGRTQQDASKSCGRLRTNAPSMVSGLVVHPSAPNLLKHHTDLGLTLILSCTKSCVRQLAAIIHFRFADDFCLSMTNAVSD